MASLNLLKGHWPSTVMNISFLKYWAAWRRVEWEQAGTQEVVSWVLMETT